MTVAVLGLGAMGARIAARLLETGHELVVWNRTREKASPLVERGAFGAATPAEAAERADALITIVADPDALRAVTEGPDGVAAGAHPALTVIDMSTVGPAAVARLASALPEGTSLLDAPVFGSLPEAEAGSLTILVGGPKEVFEWCTPLLSKLGSPLHLGELGSGAAAKLVANAALFGVVTLLGEVLALARGLGLSQRAAFDVLAATPLGAQAERRRQAIESDEYPLRFSLALARKDADLVSEAAAAAGVELRVGRGALNEIRVAADRAGDRDYSAVIADILRGA